MLALNAADVSIQQLQFRLERLRAQFRRVIAQSALRSLGKSGLAIRSGNLLRNVENGFFLEIIPRGLEFILVATWTPQVPYFMRRLFGFRGTDSLGRVYRGRGFDRLKPRGWFLKFDSLARREIALIISDALADIIKGAKQEVRRERPARAARPERAMRPTPHRIRQRLVREARLSREQARQIQQNLKGTPGAEGVLEEILNRARGGGLVSFISQAVRVTAEARSAASLVARG